MAEAEPPLEPESQAIQRISGSFYWLTDHAEYLGEDANQPGFIDLLESHVDDLEVVNDYLKNWAELRRRVEALVGVVPVPVVIDDLPKDGTLYLLHVLPYIGYSQKLHQH